MSGRFAIFAITLTTRRAASARLPAPSHHGCRRNAIVDGEQWISIAIPGTFRSCDSGKIRRGVTLIKVMRKAVAVPRICASPRACPALTNKNAGNPDEIAGERGQNIADSRVPSLPRQEQTKNIGGVSLKLTQHSPIEATFGSKLSAGSLDLRGLATGRSPRRIGRRGGAGKEIFTREKLINARGNDN